MKVKVHFSKTVKEFTISLTLFDRLIFITVTYFNTSGNGNCCLENFKYEPVQKYIKFLSNNTHNIQVGPLLITSLRKKNKTKSVQQRYLVSKRTCFIIIKKWCNNIKKSL